MVSQVVPKLVRPFWPAASTSMSTPVWHHYVPRWYLRRFADEQRRLLAIHVDGSVRRVSVKNAAASPDFYTQWTNGRRDVSLEQRFGSLESDAAVVVVALVAGEMPDADSRAVLSLYMAAQLLRTPLYRNSFMRTIGIPIPMDQEHALMSIEIQIDPLAEMLNRRSWQCLQIPTDVLITTDHPVSMWAPGWDGVSALSVDDAAEVRWPLDRGHALILGPPGAAPEGFTNASYEMIRSLLATSVMWCEEWVYDHPSGIYTDIPPTLLKAAAESSHQLADRSENRRLLSEIDRQIHLGLTRRLRD